MPRLLSREPLAARPTLRDERLAAYDQLGELRIRLSENNATPRGSLPGILTEVTKQKIAFTDPLPRYREGESASASCSAEQQFRAIARQDRVALRTRLRPPSTGRRLEASRHLGSSQCLVSPVPSSASSACARASHTAYVSSAGRCGISTPPTVTRASRSALSR
jgi:hypothetical protein